MLRLIPLGGFLGAGKTTTMLALAHRLTRSGRRVAVIANDQGDDLIDAGLADRARRLGELAGVAEITGGCFCCRFDDLATVIAGLRTEIEPDVVIAEAVGSCTDLQSTVVRPLRAGGTELSVAPLTVLLEPARYAEFTDEWSGRQPESDLGYLLRHQLDEADVIAINKIDTIRVSERAALVTGLATAFPTARIVTYSARTGAGMTDLLGAISTDVAEPRRGFAVDYDRYAAAEAALAWTNQTFELRAATAFRTGDWARALLGEFGRAAADDGAVIGHVKVLVAGRTGASKASLLRAGGSPSLDLADPVPTKIARVILNARVQAPVDALGGMIDRAVTAADGTHATRSSTRAGRIFQPGYPTPVHRM